MNPGVNLPHQTIVPIRREDASGDTFIFTQFLDFSTQSWEDKIGYGTSVDWPAVSGELKATGNEGMVKTLAATPYSVALYQYQLSRRDRQSRARDGDAEKPERQVRIADGRYDQRRRLGARPTHAAGRAVEPGFCDRRRFLPAGQLRIRRSLDPATRSRNRRGAAQIPAMGDFARGWQCAEIPGCGRFHPAARFHPGAERAPDQPDQIVP